MTQEEPTSAYPGWYRSFFGPDFVAQARQRLTPERTRAEVHFLVDQLGLGRGAPLLDLACGHGRHLVELAARGLEVVGLDLSDYSLGVARAQAGAEARLVGGDMRWLPFADGSFAGCINMQTAFGYLDRDEDDQTVLAEVARVLRPGGRFLMDYVNREWLVRVFQPRGWEELEDGTVMLQERAFDLATGRNNVVLTFIRPDGSTRTFPHSLRVYALTELRRMLRAAGLEPLAAYGGPDGRPLGFDDRWLMLVAEKPV